MTLIRFLQADGALDREVEAAEGDNLLDVAQAADQPLEGTCGKAMSCSTFTGFSTASPRSMVKC